MLMQNDTEYRGHTGQSISQRPQTAETTIAFGAGETVLLIEQDETLLKLGKNLLENLNYQVLTASDCHEVAKQAYMSRYKIDLLILDGAAPITDSKEIVRRVREHRPQAKTLFSTVHDTKLETECGKKISSEKILSKPYTIHSFSQTVYQILL
jgi:DNA-binding response OmpR family regulator